MPSVAYIPLKPSKEELPLQLPEPICQPQDPVGLCQAEGQKERSSSGVGVAVMSLWMRWGSGGKMSASAARLSIAGGVRCSAVTAHLSSAPHNWFGSGHTTSLFKIKKKKAEASICLGAPLLFV